MNTKLSQFTIGFKRFRKSQLTKVSVLFLNALILFGTSTTVNGFFQSSPPIIFSIAWSPDGTKFAVTRSGYIDIINASTNTVIRTLSGGNSLVTSIDWSPDGAKIVGAILEYPGVYVWSVVTGQILATERGAATSVKWNPDNNRVAITLMSDAIIIWDSSTGQRVAESPTFGGFIDWSPDGSKIASGSGYADPISVANVTTKQILFTLSGHSGGVQSVDWSPDGTKIASSGDNIVRVWNATTGATLLALTGHTNIVSSVAWNTNNSTLASGSADGTVRLWNTQTGQSMGVIQAGGVIRSVAWSPDGKKLAYGGDTGVVQTVELNTRPNSGTGLRVQYFDNLNFVTPKYSVLTPTINFNWAATAPLGLSVDTFSSRWAGKIEPLYSETYTFYVTHDDGARLWINGQQMVNNWTNVASAVVDSGTITLAAGVKYDITLEYYENTGNASVKLEWQSASQARQVVPSTQLYAPEGQLIFTG